MSSPSLHDCDSLASGQQGGGVMLRWQEAALCRSNRQVVWLAGALAISVSLAAGCGSSEGDGSSAGGGSPGSGASGTGGDLFVGNGGSGNTPATSGSGIPPDVVMVPADVGAYGLGDEIMGDG